IVGVHVVAVDLAPDQRAVLALLPALGDARPAGGEYPVRGVAERLVAFHVGKMHYRELPDQLLARVAHHAREGLVHPQVAPVDGKSDADERALQYDVALRERALEAFLQLLALGDVDAGPDGALRRALRIERAARAVHPDERAVLPLELLLGNVGAPGAQQGIGGRPEHVGALAFRGQQGGRLPGQLVALVSQHPREGFVEPRKVAVCRERDAYQHALEHAVALEQRALDVVLRSALDCGSMGHGLVRRDFGYSRTYFIYRRVMRCGAEPGSTTNAREARDGGPAAAPGGRRVSFGCRARAGARRLARERVECSARGGGDGRHRVQGARPRLPLRARPVAARSRRHRAPPVAR